MKYKVGSVKRKQKSDTEKDVNTGDSAPVKPSAHTKPFQLSAPGGKKKDTGKGPEKPEKSPALRRLGKKQASVQPAQELDTSKPEKRSFLSSLTKIAPLAKKREQYDPKIHGMMVNLTFEPPPGTEEIEV
jgi:hypothetical protein